MDVIEMFIVNPGVVKRYRCYYRTHIDILSTHVLLVLHVVLNAQVLYIMQYVWSYFTDRLMCLCEGERISVEWISMHSCSRFPSSASQSPSGPH